MMVLPRARSSAVLEPRHLLVVDALGDARVDGEQREAVGLHLEERRALESGGHGVFARSLAASAISSSMRASVVVLSYVRVDARAHGGPRGARRRGTWR